ncbi:MAG: hypothetical protein DMG56_10840 [Acidobacteria bacterium]|nr:MAG: hypothetical protein DMG55_14800 [Acidobacteriota bacterium]PYU63016.1 MAG: hypothetical protein DMG56_10840 [Acidobacteriota bacterium]
MTLQIAEDQDFSFEFYTWPDAIILKPPRNNCLLPGVLVLRNIAQVAENQMSLSDSCRRLHNVRQGAG